MNNQVNDQLNENNDREIDLLEIFNLLNQGKWIIVSMTAFFSIIGVIYSLLLPNIYSAQAILAPVSSSGGISGALKNYGGLASLAGINIPSGNNDKSTQAIKKLSSLSFFENNVLPYIFLPDLMAVKSWNSQDNTLAYDDSIYKEITNTWVQGNSFSNTQMPSAQDGFKVFIEEHLSVSEERKTGFVTLQIKHQSPFVANQWAELMINQINTFYRQKDKLESEKAVSYLTQQIVISRLQEVKVAFADLIQEETKKLTLIEAKNSYVFEYVDPPAVMERKSEPWRSLIVILSTLLGGILGIIFVLVKTFVLKEKAS
jgi:uncharacterized protein involved in exopolysaccharide biosynthesis